jgi:glycosyltransferase involved in cell wall biosynthesis
MTDILFVGDMGSSHAQSWIDLLGDDFSLRAFSFPGRPASAFPVRTTIALDSPAPPGNALHDGPGPWTIVRRRTLEALTYVGRFDWTTPRFVQTLVASSPSIVHTFGLEPAGALVARLRRQDPRVARPHWVAQLRGGSDLELRKYDPQGMRSAAEILSGADMIVSDNRRNFQYLKDAGVSPDRFAPISPVPGSGGVDLGDGQTVGPATAERRLILWPKTYNTPYTQALPVLEALRLAWDRVQPARIVALWAVQPEVLDWMRAVTTDMGVTWDVRQKVGHDEVMSLLREARVMLAPSLVDGIPNMLYEAMAMGAVPIVSPLNTISDVVRDGQNVIFARNLYPHDIADALVRAMTDDALATSIAANNVARVREIADRKVISRRVRDFYRDLLARAPSR